MQLVVTSHHSTSWSAVSRGALLRGLDLAMVDRRITRYHFGIPIGREFRVGIDSEDDSYICPFKGKMARGYIKWCVSKVQLHHISPIVPCRRHGSSHG